MLAIQKATEYIHAVHDLIDTSHIRIITDNQSAITALCNPCSKKSLVIQTRLNIITSPIQIRLEWVKAHHLDVFNNEVDLLAKQAYNISSLSFISVPQSFLISEIEKVVWKTYFHKYETKINRYYWDNFFNKPKSVRVLKLSEFNPHLIHFLSNKRNFSQHLL